MDSHKIHEFWLQFSNLLWDGLHGVQHPLAVRVGTQQSVPHCPKTELGPRAVIVIADSSRFQFHALFSYITALMLQYSVTSWIT